ncbi:MAG: hypothetical protein KatS3mg110_1779 [Pirellulaceae bacterium]|nr:MAG: hypothetical protein KatS3mg110_1779 [Pirellulaceae bacterium]
MNRGAMAVLVLWVMTACGCIDQPANPVSKTAQSNAENSATSGAAEVQAPAATEAARGSVAAQPSERTVNPFGAAGIIQPSDPLLGGAPSASGPPPGTAAPGYPAGSPAPNYAPPPGYSSPSGYAGSPGYGPPPGTPPTPGYPAGGYPPAAGAANPGGYTAPGDAASNPAGNTTRVPAQVGVGRRGRSLDQFNSGVQRVIAEPARSLFAARERMVFQVSIPHALQLFQAEKGYLPRSHEEFMREIIEYNRIPLPELPPGHRYVYDPQRGELMVERPAP